MRRTIEHQQRVSFLAAYLGNQRGTTVLAVANSSALLVCAWMSGADVFVALALCNAVAHLIRLRVSDAFGRLDLSTLTTRDVRLWEWRTLLLGGGLASVFGLACMVAFNAVEDELTRDFVVMLTTANTLGVVARSFGIVRLVRFQLALICAPLAIGLLGHPSAWSWLLAGFVVPFALVVDMLASKLRNDLMKVVNERADAAEMAERFSASLTAVPEALVHLDAANRIAVMNRAARELFQLDSTPRGEPFEEVVRKAATFGPEDCGHLIDAIRGGQVTPTLGALGDRRYTVRAVRAETNTLLLLTDVTERERSERELVRLARTDTLTGLAARGWLSECGREAVAGTASVSLALVDIDEFKSLNDTFGQAEGDATLVRLAGLLSDALPDALAARLGADEFAVLASDDAAADLDDRIRNVLHRFREEGQGIGISVSATAGTAGAAPDETFDALLARSSIALRAAKRERARLLSAGEMPAPRLRRFDGDLHRAHEQRLAVKAALARDLPTGRGIALAYQPIVDPRRGVTIAAEALCRWHCDEVGNVTPDVFIPLTEELGLIRILTDMVLAQATAACASWAGEARVSVNLAAADLQDDALPKRVEAALRAANLPGERLQLEITEGHVIRDDARTRNVLEALRRTGVAIAIDDFGTGYSNLAVVERLPLDAVKLDRSLVARIGEDRPFELLSASIELFHRLGLRVVVEGVEMEEQVVRLGTKAPEALIQGYVFGRPMSESMMAELMGRSGVKRRTKRTIPVSFQPEIIRRTATT